MTGRVVYVLEEGELKHIDSIRHRGLQAWVAFVGEQRGWQELYVDERPISGWLIDALEGSA